MERTDERVAAITARRTAINLHEYNLAQFDDGRMVAATIEWVGFMARPMPAVRARVYIHACLTWALIRAGEPSPLSPIRYINTLAPLACQNPVSIEGSGVSLSTFARRGRG